MVKPPKGNGSGPDRGDFGGISGKEQAETRRNRITLAALLDLLQEQDCVFIVRRIGPHECEGVTGGTVHDLHSMRCAEVYGDNVVTKLWLENDDWPEVWPDGPAPVLVIVIGGKEGSL